MRVLLTGATGMVGEGVLLECLDHPEVTEVLVLGRRPCGRTHAKLNELLVPDFLQLEGVAARLGGFDACLYCAGISSVGMSEADYTRTTYDAPLHLAKTLVGLKKDLVFVHLTGRSTDGTGEGKVMWARVKGRAENAISALGFEGAYHFRPALMVPTRGQTRVKGGYALTGTLTRVFSVFFPGSACTIQQVGHAMLNAVKLGYEKRVLEVADIKALAARA